MQSVVLAIVEEMNNMNCKIDSKSIQFCHSDNLENSNFRSISTVGVECGIESHVLNTVGMTADFLQIASQIFQSSNYFSKFCMEEFVKVLSAIIIPLGMDFGEVHKILKDLKIETFASSPIIIENGSKHPLNSNNSSSGMCNVQDRTGERVVNEFLNCDVPDDDEQKNVRTYDYESSINNKNINSKTEIKNKNNTFSLSLLMPIFKIENDFNEESHSNKSNGSIEIDEVSIPSTGPEKSIPNRKRRKNSMKNSPNEIANLCYRLLSNEDEVVCSDKEQLNSCISKTLAVRNTFLRACRGN